MNLLAAAGSLCSTASAMDGAEVWAPGAGLDPSTHGNAVARWHCDPASHVHGHTDTCGLTLAERVKRTVLTHLYNSQCNLQLALEMENAFFLYRLTV